MNHKGKIFLGVILDIFETIFIGVAVFLFVYVFVGQLLRVTGDSMLPNFKDGEQIIAEKVSVKTGSLKRGDVVIFSSPENQDRLVIKRVIGLPYEMVSLVNGKVYINGEALAEPYLASGMSTQPGKFLKEGSETLVPGDSYVFLGDNRNSSTDSREWGPIKKDLIVAKGFLIYYPLNELRLIN